MKRRIDSNVLEPETIGEGNRHYFVDLCLAVNNKQYLRMVRSDRIIDENGKVTYKREMIRVFEENLGPLIDAMSNVFGRYNARQV
jgi:hypothetical protein